MGGAGEKQMKWNRINTFGSVILVTNLVTGASQPTWAQVPEPGSMCYMMSKQQNFGPKFGNADPHLMFWFPQKDHVNWGADFPGSPIDVHQYSPQPITEFDISVSKWSDGTAA
jgi:hypothetical protein